MRDILRNPEPLDGFEPFTSLGVKPTVRLQLWNDERGVVALRPTSAETHATVSVRLTKTGAAYIPLTALFRTLGIPLTALFRTLGIKLTKSVEIPVDVTDGITFIDLSDVRA